VGWSLRPYPSSHDSSKKSLHAIPNENLIAARKKIVLMNVARVGKLVLLLSLVFI
jgi:hypothetical protein